MLKSYSSLNKLQPFAGTTRVFSSRALASFLLPFLSLCRAILVLFFAWCHLNYICVFVLEKKKKQHLFLLPFFMNWTQTSKPFLCNKKISIALKTNVHKMCLNFCQWALPLFGWGGLGGVEKQSLSGVTTICVRTMQSSSFAWRWSGVWGPWNGGSLPVSGCVKLPDIGRMRNMNLLTLH